MSNQCRYIVVGMLDQFFISISYIIKLKVDDFILECPFEGNFFT